MATIPINPKRKRQISDYAAAEAGERPRGKKLKIGSAAQQSSTMSLNPLKSRLRSLTRSLTSTYAEKLPANVRVTQERELAALRSEIQRLEGQKLRKKMIERYHMVRFFERRKAERALKKAERKLRDMRKNDAPIDETKVVEEEIWRREVDVNYTIYSPLAWKYCSLYPPKSGQDDHEENGNEEAIQTRGDSTMWKRVEEATRSGSSALGKLREELPTGDVVEPPANHGPSQRTGTPKQPTSKKQLADKDTPKAQQNRRERRALEKNLPSHKKDSNNYGRAPIQADDEDDDDGGFFE